MRTRTIFEAARILDRYLCRKRRISGKEDRMRKTFRAELYRRMDERDAWAAQRDWDALPGPILRDAQGHKYKMPKPHILGGK